MRQLVVLATILSTFACASSASAKSIADSTAYQGSLNDASGNPVPDGPRDLTITIWTDSVGGTMVHSEIVTVNIKKGLFSTCIGCGSSSFFDIFTDQSLYLQTQLAGQPPMTPRTLLRNVPRALTSSRVRGDIETSAGALRVAGSSTGNVVITGDPDFDLLRMTADADSAKIRISGQSIGDPDFDLLRIQGGVGMTSSGASMTMTGDPDFDLLRMSVDADSAKIRISGQSIGDPDFDLLRIQGGVGMTSSGATMTITGDPDFDLLRMSADADSAKIRISAQSIGDPDFDLLRIVGGSGESHLSMHSAPSSAVGVANTWRDDDCDGISARSVLGGKSGSTTGTIRMQASPDSGVTVIERDSDGDGIPEASDRRGIVKGDCDYKVMSRSGSTTATIRQYVSPDSGVTVVERDSDGDGIPEASDRRAVAPSGTHHIAQSRGGGMTDNSTTSTTDETAARWILRYSSPSGISRVRQMATPDSAGTVHEVDLNGDGVPEISANITVPKQTQGSSFGEKCDMNGDGVPESEFEQLCAPDSLMQFSRIGGGGGGSGGSSHTMRTRIHELETILKNIGLLGTSKVTGRCDSSKAEIRAERTAAGATGGVVLSSSDTASSITIDEPGTSHRPVGGGIVISSNATASSIAIDEPGAHIAMSTSNSGGVATGTFEVRSGPDLRISLNSDGDGYFAGKVGIGLVAPTHAIHHVSGAHLTVGGVWTNASDAGLKENFQPVDGGALLKKIDELPISQWNYKNESDEVTHIGPTAQDFQKVFGVGEDDKTISTIDPSGIALAAIKKLNEQNRELKAQNANLKKQLDNLARKVEKLASGR